MIRGLLEEKMKGIICRRDELKKWLKGDLSKKDEEDIQENLKMLGAQLSNLQFSVEMLIRELYYLKDIQNEFQDAFYRYANQTLLQGQPLELVDGDNLLFMEDIKSTFNMIEDKDSDLLVVSVIGPQSAGKSLLLNFLFGAQFLTSAGRCTKGIYCSLMRYKCEKT